MSLPRMIAGPRGSLWPTAGTVGGFVLAGSHTPRSALTGEVVQSVHELPLAAQDRLRTGSAYVDIRCDRFIAQAWQSIRNLEATLAAAGSGLDRLVLLRVAFRRAMDVPTFLRIASACLGQRLPACDLMVAAADAFGPDTDLLVDGIAVDGDQRPPEPVSIAEMAGLTAPFPTAMRTGSFLFTSALPGLDPHEGVPLCRARELDGEDRRLVEALRPANAEIEAFFVEQATMWRNLRRVLDAVGLSLADVVHHGAWLTRSMQYLAFGSIPRLMTADFRTFCLTCFTAGGVAHPETQWSGRLVACFPGSGIETRARIPLHPLSRAYHGMVQAGPLLLTAGEVPIDVERHALVDRPSRLPEGERGLLAGHPRPPASSAAQIAYVYRLIERALRGYDAGFDAVAHQTLYLTDLSDLPMAMLIAQRFYGGRLPATSTVPVGSITAFDEARVEIEVVAAARPDR